MPPHKSSKSIRTPNAWILFSNNYYELHCKPDRLKRTDAMKLAKIEWDSMSNPQKYPWYHLSNQIKLEQLNFKPHFTEKMYDCPIIFEHAYYLSNNKEMKIRKEPEDELYLELFNELLNPEMFAAEDIRKFY